MMLPDKMTQQDYDRFIAATTKLNEDVQDRIQRGLNDLALAFKPTLDSFQDLANRVYPQIAKTVRNMQYRRRIYRAAYYRQLRKERE